MTTKPKARKFRIRPDALHAAAAPAEPMPFAQDGDGFEGLGPITPPKRAAADDLASIEAEGLSARQLRMARRIAQKRGIAAASDHDAVRLLRAQGIDPFRRETLLELVRPANDAASAQLPQRNPMMSQLPAPNTIYDQARREQEITQIQRDIARRRRRKLLLLITRLAFFVMLPTLLTGYYYYNIATPMYASNSEFVIQQAEPAAGGALGGLFSGTSFATSQDSIAVQSYLQSRDAMLRLDADIGFKAHFSDPAIDQIQRLPADATNEEAYALYRKNVTIGYDPTEGIIKMEVVAADPAISTAYSRALIDYAEERVDHLTQRLREDQMQGATASYENAEARMIEAQMRVVELQEQMGVLDPASESGALMGQISTFEIQLQEKRLQLSQLLDNRSPNQARVDGVQGDIGRLERIIAELRGQMTSGSASNASLARITSELRVAEVDLQTRQLMMQQALQQLETARIEANRQVRYLSEGVSPVAPDQARYPRKFENTLLAFLIFSGIYLMASLTASVLREQVSA